MKQTRRKFIKNTGIASIGIGFIGLQTFINSCKNPVDASRPLLGEKYGPLLKDPLGILDLPESFTYKIIATKGQKMDDGFLHPDKPDGMATFEGQDGKVIIIRNHEIDQNRSSSGAFGEELELLPQINESSFYDFGSGVIPCVGGTTTLLFNEESQEIEFSFLSLVGTVRNCAGGPTPWNSWLSCEETMAKAGNNLEKNHGYVFEVPVTETPSIAPPIPIKAMGRFNHEAVCVDPNTGIVYLTEDRNDGLIYRFIPNEYGNMLGGGKLQALAIINDKGADTRNWRGSTGKKIKPGQSLEIEWLDLENIDPSEDDLRIRGHEAGAAIFARGEGMWYGNNEVYFACTSGGRKKSGQVFKYIPSEHEGTENELEFPGILELFIEPNNTEVLKYCDNLTVAPTGDVIMCEDNENPYIIGVSPDGTLYKLAHNVGVSSEFAGAVFSPSGKTLFVNIQHAGLTIAIQGPWV